MDQQIQGVSKKLAISATSRRGFVGSLGRASAAVGALGLGLAGVPSALAAEAASGSGVQAMYAGVHVVPVQFDPKHLGSGQTNQAVLGVKPSYPTNQNGCACPGDGANPCSTCSYYSRTQLDGPYWARCTSLPCCCNPCSDTCCSLGRAMTWQYYNWQYHCSDGSTKYAAVATGNFGCDTYNTCTQGSCC